MKAKKKVIESEIDFLALSKKEQHPRARMRLLGLAHVKDDVSYRDIVKMLKVALSTVQEWVNKFGESGLEGLQEKGNRGRKPKLLIEQEFKLKKIILKKQATKKGGALIGEDIQKIIFDSFGVKYALRTTYKVLHRIGLSWVSSRSKHPKSDKKAQEKFKKDFKKKMKEVVPEGVNLKDIDVWFQDEARVGQQGTTSRMWGPKGYRPTAKKQLQYINTFIFGAVCPKNGSNASIIVPYVGAITMQEHLKEISRQVPKGRHAVVVLDQAAWHTSKKLKIPKNISLLSLPPYSPELNPCEQIWQHLRKHYLSNRCFKNYDCIVNACVHAWNKFTRMPGKITSLCSRSWAIC